MDITELIQQQNRLLQQLLDHFTLKEQGQLGFGAAPQPAIIYCNRTQCPPYYWYRRVNGENQGIGEGSLTGYLRKLEFVITERRGKETRKLHATIEADQTWILECSETAVFAKGLLAAVAALSPDQLRQPIQIVPLPGEDEKVLFCQIWWNGSPVEAKQWNSETDFEPIAYLAFQHVKGHSPPATNAERVREARETVGLGQEEIREILINEYSVKHPDQLSPRQCEELIQKLLTHHYPISAAPT
ncbi:MAG: hypothetical protein HC921_14150 [Synechococcaceae cyanobacterium SM2_3_1]|nr:hypothetical protein [Synechococcaceae cyanobacterium SM2_3_1]